ncbi:MAG: hypothetical protein AAF358_05605 [Pseudomonadota bacterium]
MKINLTVALAGFAGALATFQAVSQSGSQARQFAAAELSADGTAVVLLVSSGGGATGGNEALVFNRQDGTVTQVHLNSAGNPPGNFDVSGTPSLSANGEVVALASFADLDLSNPDGNGTADAYVRLVTVPDTRLVSRSTAGEQSSAGGQLPVVSDDGQWVAFQTVASNLEPADNDGGGHDIFLHNLSTSETRLVSLDETGAQLAAPATDPRISADGRFVAFEEFPGAGQGNVLRVADTQAGTSVIASRDDLGQTLTASQTLIGDLSADGRWLTFQTNGAAVAADANGESDVYLRDLTLGITERVSLGAAGAEGDGAATDSRVSDNGNLIAFESTASNLVADDTNGVQDVFVRDRGAATTRRVSVTTAGGEVDAVTELAGLSADGRWVLLRSASLDLADGAEECAGSLACNVFVHDRDTGVTQRIPTPDAVAESVVPPLSLAAGDRLGASVAVRGSDLASGLPGSSTDQGAVAIYRIVEGRAQPQPTLEVPIGFSASGFGAAVSISGDLMVVGASQSVSMKGPGERLEVAVYERAAGQWVFHQALSAPVPGTAFGAAVAIDRSLLLIGAPEDAEGEATATASGAAYLYARSGPGEDFELVNKVKLAGAAGGSSFGTSVALNNGVAAVGAPGASAVGGTVSGVAGIYAAGPAGLTLLAVAEPSGPQQGEQVGFSVAVSGAAVVVAGAPGAGGAGGDNEGTAYLFSSAGAPLGQLLPDDPVPDGRFGTAVAVSDRTLAVGSPGALVANVPVGAIYRFELNAASAQPVRRRSARAMQLGFGEALAVSGQRLLIGAPESEGAAGAVIFVTNPRQIFLSGFED